MTGPDDGGSITAPWCAADYFTDRDDVSRLFINRLNDDISQPPVLFFHGAGGSGKTWLLERLRRRLCKRLDYAEWSQIRLLSHRASVERVEEASTFKAIPRGAYDFDRESRDGITVQRALRKQLNHPGLTFPLNDFAVITSLHKSGELGTDKIKELFPADDVALLLEFVGSFEMSRD